MFRFVLMAIIVFATTPAFALNKAEHDDACLTKVSSGWHATTDLKKEAELARLLKLINVDAQVALCGGNLSLREIAAVYFIPKLYGQDLLLVTLNDSFADFMEGDINGILAHEIGHLKVKGEGECTKIALRASQVAQQIEYAKCEHEVDALAAQLVGRAAMKQSLQKTRDFLRLRLAEGFSRDSAVRHFDQRITLLDAMK